MRTRQHLFRIILPAAVILSLILLPAAYGAQQGLDFYKGRTGRFVVPYSPGGGYDVMARTLIPYLEKYLPGSTWIVLNKPGAGGLVGTNFIYKSKPDGLTIGIVPGSGIVVDSMVEKHGVYYDLDKFNWLGRFTGDLRFIIVRSALPIKTVADLLHYPTPLKQSFTEVGSPAYAVCKILNKALPYKYTEITGYPGRPEEEMAFIRGDIDLLVGTMSSLPLVQRGEGRLIAMACEEAPTGFKIDFAAVPNLFKPDGRKLVAPENLKWLDLMESVVELGRPLVAPPKVPGDRAAALQTAIRQALHDPDFIKDIEKRKLPVAYLDPQKTQKLIMTVVQSPPNIKFQLKEMMKPKN